MSNTEPICDQSAHFLMWVEDIVWQRKEICVVIGLVERGTLELNARAEVVGGQFAQQVRIADIEQFYKKQTVAICGEQAGVLLRPTPEELTKDCVIAAPGSIQAYTKFRGNIQLLSEAEGRENHALLAGKEVLFFFRNVYVPGTYTFLDGFDLAVSANRVILICTLTRSIAMEEGQEFTVHSGGKVVGMGKVVELMTKL